MSKKTVVNESYKGLVESFSIPAEVRERDGKKFATFGSVVPVHCCTQEEVERHAATTHHYCDIFTDDVLAPLGELAFVRLDENTAEKVFINRSKRLLLLSSDGRLAQWRCAPTFESANAYLAGAPVVNKDGALVTLTTARRGNHYAVSTFEGDSGYFNTPLPWKVIRVPDGHLVYGDRTFATREALREFAAGLPPPPAAPLTPADLPPPPAAPLTPADLPPPSAAPLTPVLALGAVPRVTLTAENGTEIAHFRLQSVMANDVEYL